MSRMSVVVVVVAAASHTLKGKIFLILHGHSSQMTRGVILALSRFVLCQGCDVGHYPVG